MDSESLTPENVSSLIDFILKDKDPASIGLRKIIKGRTEASADFPLHKHSMEHLDTGVKKSKLSDDEQLIVTLEKQIYELKEKVKKGEDSARNAVQTAYKKGFQEGLTQGSEKGFTQANTEYQKKITAIQTTIASYLKNLEESKRSLFVNVEHVLLKFCCELTKKIIATEVITQNETIVSVIKKALSYIGNREKLILRIAPSDYDIVNQQKDFWAPVSDSCKDVSIEKDDRIEKGGCIIESNSGMVDARLGVQFNELTDLIEKMWQEHHLSNTEQ